MEAKHMTMITRVRLEYKTRKLKNGSTKDGPYWFGYYQLNGKTSRVYIGKELPPELAAIPGTGIKPKGRIYHSWPGRAQAA